MNEYNPDGKREILEKKPSFFSEIVSTLLFCILVVAITFLFVTFVGQRTVVVGSSMETTLSDGDSLIIDKLSYRFRAPKRFDIVVFPYAQDEDTFYIKRIIGLPGETIQIDYDGNIYIDGVILEENFGWQVIENPGVAENPITLGEDEYFVMGDNRNNSHDSRMEDVGNIHRDRLEGRALVRIYPFNQITVLQHGDGE